MTFNARIIVDMQRLLRSGVKTMVPLRDLTSFRIGGAADAVVEPCDLEEMANVRLFLTREGVPNIVLGAGTNVLCSDKGYRGVIILTTGLKGAATTLNGAGVVHIAAGAGVGLTGLITRAHRAGCSGMEPLWGIPGSVGGSIAVNAGAGGVAACDFVEELKLVNRKGAVAVLRKDDLDFRYRYACLPDSGVVVKALFRFPSGDPFGNQQRLQYWMRVRKEQQPWRIPSAGCVFKNPDRGDPAGAILDRLGFKGISEGGAQVSPVHANFIVNKGGATAEDVLGLIRRIRRRVNDECHIRLELEIQLIGEGFEHADTW